MVPVIRSGFFYLTRSRLGPTNCFLFVLIYTPPSIIEKILSTNKVEISSEKDKKKNSECIFEWNMICLKLIMQVRCKHPGLCRSQGTTVMLADSHGDSSRDFVLNKKAMITMANKGHSENLLKLGVVDIEYKR